SGPAAHQQREQRRGRGGARDEEHEPEEGGVRPDRAVRDRQEHTGVAGEEDAEESAEPRDGDAEGGRRTERSVLAAALAAGGQERQEREEAEREQRPGADGAGRVRLENERTRGRPGQP